MLKDTTTLAENEIKENEFIVCMVTKEAGAPKPAPATIAPPLAVAPAAAAATAAPAPVSTPGKNN